MSSDSPPKTDVAQVAYNVIHLVLLAVTLVVVVVVGLVIWRSRQEWAEVAESEPTAAVVDGATPMDQSHFSPVQVVAAAPPITQVPVVSAEVASRALYEDEQVVAVVIGGQARAYPLNILTGPDREVFNDELGGEPIAVTWCHLCNSAVTFSRRVNQAVITLAVSGMLWEGNLIMVDHPTGSLWSQLQGRAMRGPLAGKSLTILPSVITTWGDWKKRYPTTTAVLMSRTADVYRRSGADPHMGLCLAIERNGDAIAFDFADLARHLAIQHTIAGTPILVSFDRQSFTAAAFDRRLDGRILSFEVQDDHIIESATASRLDPVSGSFVDGPLQGKSLTAIPSMIADPATWSLFHPDGLLWRAPHNPPHDLPAVPR